MTAKPVEEQAATKTGRNIRLPAWRWRLPWVLIIILLFTSGFLFYQYRQAQDRLNGSATSGQYEKRLGKLILLPSNEKPIVRTVSNVARLKTQAFFRNAKNGDVLFVYNQARQAILYRPSSNMIINVQPIAGSS